MKMGALVAWIRANPLIAALYAAAIAGHLIVRGVYEPANVDDPWTLSFIHTWLTTGDTADLAFGNAIGNDDGGQSGLEFFGKIQALVYGPILQLLDWNRSAAHAISTVFVAASMPLWWRIAAFVTPRANVQALFVVCLFVSEPVVAASNEARPDALAFFLATGSLFAISRRRLLIAGLLSALAFEVHPMGAISALFGAALHLSDTDGGRGAMHHASALLRYAAGLLIGLSAYVLLHLDALSELPGLLGASNGGTIGKSLLMYTFDSFAYRHVPEAILFAVAALVFLVTGLWRRERGVALLLVAAAVSLVLFRRGNHHYMLYYAPIALLVGAVVAVRFRRQAPAAALFVVLMLGQYGATAWRNAGFDLDRYVSEMRRHVPAGRTPIVAEYNAWFAFYDRPFFGSYKYDAAFYYDRQEFETLGLTEFTLVDRLETPQGPGLGWRERVMPQRFACEPRGYFTIQGRHYGTFSCADAATP